MLARLLRLIANRCTNARARVEIFTSINPVHLSLEIADKRWQRALGMMGKKEMRGNDGMIFIYPRPRTVCLWMANTPLSLDAIFVDDTGRILKIASHLQPNSRRRVCSGQCVKWILEITGGESIRLGIATGDRVRLIT